MSQRHILPSIRFQSKHVGFSSTHRLTDMYSASSSILVSICTQIKIFTRVICTEDLHFSAFHCFEYSCGNANMFCCFDMWVKYKHYRPWIGERLYTICGYNCLSVHVVLFFMSVYVASIPRGEVTFHVMSFSTTLYLKGLKWQTNCAFMRLVKAYTTHMNTRTWDVMGVMMNTSSSVSVGVVCECCPMHIIRHWNAKRQSERFAMTCLQGCVYAKKNKSSDDTYNSCRTTTSINHLSDYRIRKIKSYKNQSSKCSVVSGSSL